MAVYDVNGDGLNDVVTSLQAHGLGLSWFEQKKAADGSRSFVEHPIMTDFSTKNAGGVIFSQLHGATYADVDGDGLQDFITGKRFWSHLDTFIDPDPHGAPVLYVYRTVRNPKAPGGAEFVPELIHNRSGVGSHLSVVDLNKDGSTGNHHVDQAGHVYLLEQLESGEAINMRLLHATAAAHRCRHHRRRSGAESGKRLAVARARCRRAAILAAQADQHIERVESQPGVELRHAGAGTANAGSRSRQRGGRRTRRSSARARRRPGCVSGAGDSGTTAVGCDAARGRRRHVHRRRCTTASSRWMPIPEKKSGSRTSATPRRRGASRTGQGRTAFRRSWFSARPTALRC